jgi:hypothetical protein
LEMLWSIPWVVRSDAVSGGGVTAIGAMMGECLSTHTARAAVRKGEGGTGRRELFLRH